MSFFFTLLYIILLYIFPAELVPELAPYRITLVIGIVGLVISFVRLVTLGRLDTGRPQIYLIISLTAVMAISVLWVDRWLFGPVYVLEDFGVSLIMFLLTLWNIDSVRKLQVSVAVIVLMSIFLSVQGIAAFHYGFRTDQLLMTDSGEDDESDDAGPAQVIRIRGYGVMHDPNDLALGLVCALPLLAVTWKKKRKIGNVLLVVLPTAAIIYGMFLTHSRGAVVAILALIFVGFMPRLGRIRSVILTVIFACGLIVLNVSGGRAMTSEDDSAAGRVNSWSEGLQMLKEQPILGVGYRNYTEHNDLTAHNSFVLCFAELGLSGYFCWIALLVTTVLQLSAIARNKDTMEPALRKWAMGLKLSLVGFLAGAFFLSRTYVPQLYLLIGLAGAVATMAKQTEGAPALLPRPGKLAAIIARWELGSIVFMYVFVRVNMLLLK